MKTRLYFAVFLLAILAVYAHICSPSPAPLSPLSSSLPLAANSQLPATSYTILGFAPYWNLKKLTPASISTLTHLAYFTLYLGSDGSLYTHVNRREEEPGYTNYKRILNQTYSFSTPLILTFMPESQSALDSILSSPSRMQTTINTIVDLVKESKAVGVNIDFEPLGDTPLSQKTAYTKLLTDLRSSLPTHQISVSIYPSAAVKPRLWDLATLAKSVDYIVVMTYDYTLPASNFAGPNSPLRGAGTLFEHDIISNIAEITQLVDSRKILLGIPLYGYEWDTVSTTKYAPTESRGAVASLQRIEELLTDQTLQLLWDRNSLTPYGISSSSGTTTQIYFENRTSIELKLDFVRASNLGGIALWALGYDGNVAWLWPLIDSLNP